MISNNRIKITFTLFLTLLSISSNAIYIVVNKSNPITSISPKELKKVFLGRVVRWENNEPTIIADYVSSNKLRSKFSKKYLGYSAFKVYKIWIKNSLSGKVAPPHYFRDSEDLLEYIVDHPGAIGYVKNNKQIMKGIKYISIK